MSMQRAVPGMQASSMGAAGYAGNAKRAAHPCCRRQGRCCREHWLVAAVRARPHFSRLCMVRLPAQLKPVQGEACRSLQAAAPNGTAGQDKRAKARAVAVWMPV